MAEASECAVSLGDVFERAAFHVKTLAVELDTDRMLDLYAFYKQAKEGPCNVPRPRWFEMTAKLKWEAWSRLGNMDRESAMKNYISIVSTLDPGWEVNCSSEFVEDKENTSQNIGWVAVSCLPNTDDFIADKDKTIFDWVKEGNVEKILELGQDTEIANAINKQDDSGMGLIHWAADRGNIEVLSCLVENLKADVNLLDEDGQTALHYATSCGHMDVVRFLLEKGADSSIVDSEGNSAANIASDSEVLKLLQK